MKERKGIAQPSATGYFLRGLAVKVKHTPAGLRRVAGGVRTPAGAFAAGTGSMVAGLMTVGAASHFGDLVWNTGSEIGTAMMVAPVAAVIGSVGFLGARAMVRNIIETGRESASEQSLND